VVLGLLVADDVEDGPEGVAPRATVDLLRRLQAESREGGERSGCIQRESRHSERRDISVGV
jgi:hypothetical protein